MSKNKFEESTSSSPWQTNHPLPPTPSSSYPCCANDCRNFSKPLPNIREQTPQATTSQGSNLRICVRGLVLEKLRTEYEKLEITCEVLCRFLKHNQEEMTNRNPTIQPQTQTLTVMDQRQTTEMFSERQTQITPNDNSFQQFYSIPSQFRSHTNRQ